MQLLGISFKLLWIEKTKDFALSRHDFSQGASQSLVGCEVLADIKNTSPVYAIVSDYNQWDF